MELQLKDVTLELDGSRIITNFNYKFKEGDIYLIKGNNGVGKTVMLKTIATLFIPKQGKMILDNACIGSEIKMHEYREYISILTTTTSSLFPKLTLLQNIKFILGINNISYQDVFDEISFWINKLRLESYLNIQTMFLSKGTCQKAALLVVFLIKKKIILLDEPYDGLDEEGKKVVEEMMSEYKKNRIIIITSPIDIMTIATHIIEM